MSGFRLKQVRCSDGSFAYRVIQGYIPLGWIWNANSDDGCPVWEASYGPESTLISVDALFTSQCAAAAAVLRHAGAL